MDIKQKDKQRQNANKHKQTKSINREFHFPSITLVFPQRSPQVTKPVNIDQIYRLTYMINRITGRNLTPDPSILSASPDEVDVLVSLLSQWLFYYLLKILKKKENSHIKVAKTRVQ